MPVLEQHPAPIKTHRTLLSIFAPDPPALEPVTTQAEIDRLSRRWRMQILITSMIGYAMFYLVRKNLSSAMPVMGKELGIGKTELGLFLTLHGIAYGLSKFGNGFLGDRANARVFMAIGLILSAAMNVFFGMSSTAIMFGIFWILNGWFQGMGFPPCARLMTHWFSPKELATKMSVWNTSHSIGAAATLVLCGYLATMNWRLCFYIPAAMAIAVALVLLFTMHDSPESVGLPPVTGKAVGASSHASKDDTFGSFVRTQVFGNPFIWIVAIANFFVYSVRYAVLDWGPTLLHEAKGFPLQKSGWMIAAFEISGIVGMLASGWITDRVFGGRGSRTCLFYMALATVAVAVFWLMPGKSMPISTAILCAAGFFIYGPQALVGIIVANLATRRAAATAVGFTGIFGYASGIVSGLGLGWLAENRGWDVALQAVVALGVIGTILFAFAWQAKPHGYQTEQR